MLGTVWEDTGIFYPTEKIAADVEFGRGCFYQYYFFKTIVLDVANPEKPETIREFTADGSYYLQGRMIDNTLYLVLQKNNIYLSKENKVVLPSYSDSAESVTNKPITLDQIKIIGGDDYYYCYTLLVSFNVDEKVPRMSMPILVISALFIRPKIISMPRGSLTLTEETGKKTVISTMIPLIMFIIILIGIR